MNRKQSVLTDCKSQSELQTCESPLLQATTEPNSENQPERKKYNIISEELRRQIINKLTTEKKSIKEVSKEFNLKLSTCKAIYQVYLKEGRIGKKTTRDRKSKIINTVLVATINPMNPMQSTLTPFCQITEYKTQKNENQEENENQEKMIQDSVKKAAQHLQKVFNNSQQEVAGNVQIPQDSLNLLQQTFMQAQMQTLNQLYIQQQQQTTLQFAQQLQQMQEMQKLLSQNMTTPGNQEDDDNSNRKNSIVPRKFSDESLEKEIDQEIEETIQKKIKIENLNNNSANYKRKNSIIVQAKNEDITDI